jgi:tetratricopeptide (TPR) repeat protein
MITEETGFALPLRWRFNFCRSCAFAFIALFIVLGMIYANSFQASFQYDDLLNIVKNPNIEVRHWSWSGIQKTFYGPHTHSLKINRPLAYLSFAVNYFFHQDKVFGYHLVNFTIHYLSAVFLFLFIKYALHLPICAGRYAHTADSIALVAAFFWAAHPIQVTAVTYIVQRMAAMAGMFSILAMLAYLKARMALNSIKRLTFFMLCAAAGVLAIASKENAAMLPVTLYLLDLMLLRNRQKETKRVYLVVGVLVLSIVLGLSLFYVDFSSIPASYADRPFTLAQRLLTEPRVIIFYLSLILYPQPSRLALLHDFSISTGFLSPWITLPSILLIAACLIIAVLLIRRQPLVAFCIFFFFVNHVIEGTVIALELVYEHRNYLPSMLIFVPLAIGVIKSMQYFAYRPMLQGAIVFVTGVCLTAQAHTVYCYNDLFRHELLLWADNVAKYPKLSIGHNNLGQSLRLRGLSEAARREFEEALALDHYFNRRQKGIVLYNVGLDEAYGDKSPQQALAHFIEALTYLPGHPDLLRHTAIACLKLGDFEKAEIYLTRGLNLWPEDQKLVNSLSLLRLQQGRLDEAFSLAGWSHQRHPDDLEPLYVRAEVARREKKMESAARYWEKALELSPQKPLAALNLVAVYDRLERLQERDRYIGLIDYLKDQKSIEQFIQEVAGKEVNSYFLPPAKTLMPIFQKARALERADN